jgi:Uma2 family endonuclease
MVLQANATNEIVYPDSDGKPMADNTKQFRWIVVIKENLEWLFADHPDVFIAGDLLWYPVGGVSNLLFLIVETFRRNVSTKCHPQI